MNALLPSKFENVISSNEIISRLILTVDFSMFLVTKTIKLDEKSFLLLKNHGKIFFL